MTVDLSEFRVGRPVVKCMVADFFAVLSATDREKFLAAKASPDITNRDIFRWSKGKGYEGGESTMSRHLSEACKCHA